MKNVLTTKVHGREVRLFSKSDFTPKSEMKNSLFSNKNKYTLYEALVELYNSTSDVKDFKEVHLPPEVCEVAKDIYRRHGFDENMVHPDKVLIKQNFKEDPDAIIHLVTAGKDSTAMAKKEEGKIGKNLLFHVRGVNKIYPVEYRQCKKLYNTYFDQSEYHELQVKLTPMKNASESPLKNIMVVVLAIEYFQFIPKWISIGGSAGVSDISETEVYGDSSKGWNPLFNMVKDIYETKEFTTTPWLRDQIEPYEIMVSNKIPFNSLASCFSQARFKKLQRTHTLDNYAKVINGKYYLAGTYQGKSIFDLTEEELIKVDTTLITKADIYSYDDDYRCGKCVKCNEAAIVLSTHLDFNYHKDYVKNAKRLIVEWMDKSSNNNGVNLEQYYDKILGIPKKEIPVKYHKYMAGESIHPDGWKPPKPKKKKA